jgi:DNA-binding GntR family transcriptional regulator
MASSLRPPIPVHAATLQCLGIDHERRTSRHGGPDARPAGIACHTGLLAASPTLRHTTQDTPRMKAVRAPRRSPASTLADQVAGVLREEIIAGRIAPGAKIAEQATADRLGVSRVPVREATILLEREGLLVRSATGRRRVRLLHDHDLVEIAELRLTIEPRLAALAAEHHTAADAAALGRNLQALDRASTAARISLLDAEFHDLVAEASHQSRLAEVWRMMRGQILLLIAETQRRLPQSLAVTHDSTLAHHRAIWELIRQRKAQAAADYVERIDDDVLRTARRLAGRG